jgi:hypothetical protein
MSFFDENGEYWGNTTKPIIDAGNGRLTARSVKIFADGKLFVLDQDEEEVIYSNRCSQDWRRRCKSIINVIHSSNRFTFLYSFTSHIVIIQQPTALCG